MIRLLADVNIEGHVARLVARMQSSVWGEFWRELELSSLTFDEIGLVATDSDVTVWQRCQEREVILLTSNRNDDAPDSLESAIRTSNTPRSLPVMTIRDPDKILMSSTYADRVIDRLLVYLLEIDAVRGTGRLYIP